MSLLFCDDFNSYGTDVNHMLDGLYAASSSGSTGSGLVADPDVNATGNVYRTASNPIRGVRLRRVFPGDRDTVGVAFRLWMDGLPPDNQTVPSICFLNSLSDVVMSLRVDTIGKVQLFTGTASVSPVAESAGPVLTANAWNHIEYRAPTEDTAGVHVVKVNGITVLTSDPLNIHVPSAQFAILNELITSNTWFYYIKDLITWDTLGGENDDFFGTVQVIGRTLTGDVTKGGWTGSSGTTLFNLLNNSPPQDSTSYVSAAYPPPSPASFTLSQLSDDITTVRALVTQVRAKKVDGGDGYLQNSLISSGDAANGVSRPVTTSFTYYEDIFETDPHTSSAWTPVSADDATLKIDRTV